MPSILKMSRRIAILALLTVMVVPVLATGDIEPTCTCADARKANIWCEAHQVGYIATVPLWSKGLFDATDAHGHEIDRAAIRCDRCLDALGTDQYCQRCRVGYVGGLAYLSRLNYLLATGTRHDPEKIECRVCRAHATRFARPMKRPTLESFGWCTEHTLGWVGNVAITDRDRFEETAAEFRRLLRSIEFADTCDTCAMACFYDSYCPVCRLQYRDGRPVDGRR